MTVGSCEVCAGLDAQIQRAYEELAEEKTKGRREGEAAQRKLSRLIRAKLGHKSKEGCDRAKNQDAS